ncbi:MAG: YdcF family protein [Oscillospiraceae bacterium]|nr:YdcF family protein [Oscillospiraceae bacterium]
MKLFKQLLPFGLVLLGFLFRSFVHGHSFLGLICFLLAGVCICNHLLRRLQRSFPIAKLLRLIFNGILLVGILVSFCTLGVILRASLGADNPQETYIVVLGAKVNGTTPSLSLSDRIDAAEAYLNSHPDAIAILSGGQGSDEDISEAECMYQQLTGRGISPERLWIEDKATSTWENLKFSLDLIEEKTGSRPENIGLVSSEYHLFRAGLFAEDCGVTAVGIPARTQWVSLRINYFLREVAGVWHYLILGGQYHD